MLSLEGASSAEPGLMQESGLPPPTQIPFFSWLHPLLVSGSGQTSYPVVQCCFGFAPVHIITDVLLKSERVPPFSSSQNSAPSGGKEKEARPSDEGLL